jgi:hypothetical protein
MTSRQDDLLRWRESAMDARALSGRAADLVDAAREELPLSVDVLARIRADVLTRRPPRRRGLPLGLRFALLTAVVLASVATAKGTMLLWRYIVAPVAAPATPARHRVAPARPATTDQAAAPPVAAAPVVVPLEPPPPVMPELPAPDRARHTPPVERHAADDTATEAQLLARALSRLRQGHDPRGALALLDQHARGYPHGVLASEALSARLEADIQLDDRPAALRLLDDRKAFAGRLGAEQLLTRAELRASAGRYADALADFDRLLGPSAAAATPGNLERALYGRAVCLGHLGRDDRARADLEAYKMRYPSGRYAAEVGRLLAGTAARP